MSLSLEDLARHAIGGDRDALDMVARQLQGDIYGLALRMLWNKEAKDRTTTIALAPTISPARKGLVFTVTWR